MPYRARGKTVQVLRNGRWVLFRRLRSARAARKLATALNIRLKERGETQR